MEVRLRGPSHGSLLVGRGPSHGSLLVGRGPSHGSLLVGHTEFRSCLLRKKWRLVHLPSVYSLTDSLTDSHICPFNALVSHLEFVPGLAHY